MSTPVIETEKTNLHLTTGKTQLHILKDVTFQLNAGEVAAVVGPSGSGKTSLLMVLGGLEKATSGRVVVGGRDITDLERKDRTLRAVLAEREKLVAKLQETLSHVKTLHGLLPMCAFCHKIRNADGTWEQLESYITSHTNADFTHGFCPECNEKHYGVKMPAEASAAK